MRHAIMGALLFCALGGPIATAEEAACTGFAWPMEREAKLFAEAGQPIASGATLDALPEAAVKLSLVAQSEAAYPIARDREPKTAESKGGWIVLPAPSAAGIYQVTLSSEGWIDVAQSGTVLKSTAFASDRGCKSMHKSVRFDLKAEPVTIQLSDMPASEVTLTILPASS